MKNKESSLKVNMILNVIRTLMTVIFPLITFPYISRTLGVESLGKYNFAASVISYMSVIAKLGIDTYAIREGTKYRYNKEKINELSTQVFSINIISTVIAYFILGTLLLILPKFKGYTDILLVLSIQIIFTTIGVNWIFSIFEDYTYITIRSILFQIIAVALMFIFVEDSNDILPYAIITVVASVGGNIINFFVGQKYCTIRITFSIDWKAHLRPIIVLFATTASVTLYTSSDTVMLGFINGEYAVGIYSMSHKIYTIVKSVLFSAIMVSIPRMSLLIGQNRRKEAGDVASEILSLTVSIVVPVTIGLVVFSKDIIVLIANTEFLSAAPSFIILSIAIIFCMGGYFWGYAVLVPGKKENFYLKVTMISALINIVINVCLMPFFAEIAAAITTMIAEIVAFLVCYCEGRKIIRTAGIIKIFVKSLLGAIIIIPIAIIVRLNVVSVNAYMIVTIILSIVGYLVMEIILKNKIVISSLRVIKNKFRRRRR